MWFDVVSRRPASLLTARGSNGPGDRFTQRSARGPRLTRRTKQKTRIAMPASAPGPGRRRQLRSPERRLRPKQRAPRHPRRPVSRHPRGQWAALYDSAGAEKHHRKRDREARPEGSEQKNQRKRAHEPVRTRKRPCSRGILCSEIVRGRSQRPSRKLSSPPGSGKRRQRYDEGRGHDPHTRDNRQADAHAHRVSRQSRGHQGEGRQSGGVHQAEHDER